MIRVFRFSALVFALLAGSALGDATSYKPHATGFTLPNANQAQSAVTAGSAQTADYATTAGSSGYATNAGTAITATNATNAGYATSAGSAKTATSATSADSATYATNAGTASQAAGLTAGNNCPAGTALSVTKGVLGCVSSVTSITGDLNGSQIVGNISNVGTIQASGTITAGGNLVSSGYVNGQNGLYSGNGVYSANYYGRGGGSNATFNGTALSANSANTAGSAVSLTGQLNGSQIVGNISNVGTIQASGTITAGGNLVTSGYVNGQNGLYSGNGVYSANYYGRGGGSNATFNGTALSANSANTASSAASLTGQLNGSQIVGAITNASSINISGNIVSNNGYVYGVTGLFTDAAVYSNTYDGRWGGSNATFNGNASTAGYASSTNVGILYQNAPPNGGGQPTYSCASGYHIVSYDTNVDSTNNAFFFGCVQNGD